MAVRLSKNIRRTDTPSTNGFDLIFSANKTYNLDEIIENHRRKAGDRSLKIQVKNTKAIGEEIIKRIMNDIDLKVTSLLGTEELKDKVSNIIQAAYTAYPDVSHSDITNKNIIGFINFNINKFINNLWNQFSITYQIEFISPSSGKITYKIDDDELNSLFTKYYNQYAVEIQESLETVDEGGLAITDKKVQINPSYNDYQKYLFENEKKATPIVGTSNYRTVISWEDYSEDNRVEDEITEIPLGFLGNYITKDELQKRLEKISIGDMDDDGNLILNTMDYIMSDTDVDLIGDIDEDGYLVLDIG